MAFVDKTLRCKDCGAEFVFTAGEQEFYSTKGFENEPSRCRECRSMRKRDRGPSSGARSSRELFRVTCSECGVETEVPFKPREDRPVYCRDCFSSRRQA
ncbi:MAG: zinc-ribbon domain containing protein [Firmicutes bacterium]|nr:zinc-ribbon domain containing protein [Bacillota bacterium]